MSAHTERIKGQFGSWWERFGEVYAGRAMAASMTDTMRDGMKLLAEMAYMQGGLDAVSRAQTPLGETFRPTDPLHPHVGHLCEDLEEGRWRCVTCGEPKNAGRE